VRPAFLPLVFALSGCAGSFEESRAAAHPGIKLTPLSDRCVSLDSTRRAWGASAKGAGFLAGGAGLATIPEYDKSARVGVAIGAAAAGALAVTSVFVSEDAATEFVKEGCAQ
jgi:hypothetical protein